MKARLAAVVLAAAGILGLGSGQREDDSPLRCWESARGAAEPPACLARIASTWAPEVLGERWRELEERRRSRFRKALAIELARKLELVGSVTPRDDDPGRFGFRAGGREREAHLVRSPAGIDEIVDVLVDGRSAVAHYREESRRMLDRFSFGYLVAELDGSGVVVLEDFEDDRPGELPGEWSWRGFGEVTRIPYVVREEDGNRFLRAEDRGENVLLYLRARWSARKYPYLSWRWRIRAVPEGADERLESKADSAAGVYLTYRRKLGLVPEAVKFVFSGELAAGTAFRRPGIGMPWTVIAASGEADPGRWQRHTYHTSRVYEATFGGDPGDRPLGIGLLTDANSTEGYAAADYDDLVALARAESESTIREIVDVP